MKWWTRFKEKLFHWYWESLTGEKCKTCRTEYTEKMFGVIVAKAQKRRYGCPQDYKDVEDFIQHL